MYLFALSDEAHDIAIVYVNDIVGLHYARQFLVGALQPLAVALQEWIVCCYHQLLSWSQHNASLMVIVKGGPHVALAGFVYVVDAELPASDFEHQSAGLVGAQAFCFYELPEQACVAL